MAAFISAAMGAPKTDLEEVIARSYRHHRSADGDLRIANGWLIYSRYGTRIIWHNGGTGGFSSWCGFRPDTRLGVVVLSNSTHRLDDVGRHLLEPRWELDKQHRMVAVAAETLERYVGYYELAPGSVFHITREAGQLFAQLTGQDRFPVYAEAEDRFFYRIVDAQLTFKKNDKGEVDGLVLHQGGDKPARRLPADYKPKQRKEVEVDPKILEDYAGRYEFAPGVVLDVAARDGALFARLTGQDEFQVYPESQAKFFYKVVDAQLTFIKDKDDNVTGLILHQFGIQQKATRKKD
jgi:serine-type D-Ala-D-Ala carboxypeptidase/endopeptidase